MAEECGLISKFQSDLLVQYAVRMSFYMVEIG